MSARGSLIESHNNSIVTQHIRVNNNGLSFCISNRIEWVSISTINSLIALQEGAQLLGYHYSTFSQNLIHLCTEGRK